MHNPGGLMGRAGDLFTYSQPTLDPAPAPPRTLGYVNDILRKHYRFKYQALTPPTPAKRKHKIITL